MPKEKLSVVLGPAQETLLITLYGRAVETKKRSGLIDDPRAVEIAEQLNYNFAKWNGARSLAAATLRTRMFDEDVQAFLAEHPAGTIVELGCGLNARFERIDNGLAQWVDIDLPDAIELRRRFFPDHPRRTVIAADLTDPDWMVEVETWNRPFCFVAEGVVMYLDPPDAEQLLSRLATHFPGSWLMLDTVPTSMRDAQHRHDAMKHLPQASWFRWACDHPQHLERFAWRLERSRTLMDAGPELVRCTPWVLRALLQWFWWLPIKNIHGYKLNRFVTVQRNY